MKEVNAAENGKIEMISIVGIYGKDAEIGESCGEAGFCNRQMTVGKQ